MSFNNIIPVPRACEHDWLKPESNRTTCKLCGCDGYIYLDKGSDIEEELINMQARVDELERELENERIRLAACGVAALQNTEESIKERITKESPYWSASYSDVCNTVDREMKLERRLEANEEAQAQKLRICFRKAFARPWSDRNELLTNIEHEMFAKG